MAGRPRSFDSDAALLVAVEHFWRDGFDETTISDLTRAMGITAPSLYAAFGDKCRLFATASAHYVSAVTARTDQALSRSPLHEGIADLLRVTADAYASTESPAGCLLLSEPRLRHERAQLRDRIAEHLRRGVRQGELSADSDADALASFLMAVIGGMSDRARDGGTAAEVRAIAEVAITAFTARAPHTLQDSQTGAKETS